MEEAIASFRAAGEIPAAARAMGTLAPCSSARGPAPMDASGGGARRCWSRSGLPPSSSPRSTEVARVDASRGGPRTRSWLPTGRSRLAEELGLPRPARALGYRGMARADLGDPGGLADFREAIELATEAGQGREVALLHNNLGWALWPFEGPAATLEVLREGIAYAKARGLTGCSTRSRESSLDVLVDTGSHDEALALAAEIAPRLRGERGRVRPQRASAPCRLGSSPCGVRARRWSSGSTGSRPPPGNSETRRTSSSGLASAALGRAGRRPGRSRRGAPRRDRGLPRRPATTTYYPALLPAMVRTALAIGEPELAERLVGGLEPRTPYAEHALVAANAALTEARGDLPAAADAYADAADRWERFGVVPEQAFALLGQGRCLSGCPDRPRPHPSCSTPARSSSGSRLPPRSPRPTRSCSRRPRSVRRAFRSTPGQGADRTQRYSPVLRDIQLQPPPAKCS